MAKILKDPLEEDYPIVAPEISHILSTYSDFTFLLYLPTLEVSCVKLEWLKSLNLERIPPVLVPQILSNFIFPSYLLEYPEILMCLA